MRSIHFGSATIDIICLVAPENIERLTFTNEGRSFLMVETGRKVPAESITEHIGGGACNSAVCLARLGWAPEVFAKLGDDLNAEAVRRHLEANGVAHGRMPVAAGRATGISVLIASHDRNFSIFVHRGANELLETADLPEDAFASCDLVYVGPLSGGSADCFSELVSRGRAASAWVTANPGIRQLTSRTAQVIASLPDIDLLSINRTEAEALVPAFAVRHEGPDPLPPEDAPPLLKRGLSFGGFDMGLRRFMGAVREAGVRWIVVTDGTDGAYLAGPEGMLWHPALPAKVAGTAGAGDAYTATLSAALAEGRAPEEAMLEAAINAASVVSAIDTTSGLLTREAIEARKRALGEVPVRRL